MSHLEEFADFEGVAARLSLLLREALQGELVEELALLIWKGLKAHRTKGVNGIKTQTENT